MKQYELEKSAEYLLSANTTTSNTTSTSSTTTASTAALPQGISTEYAENAHNNKNKAASKAASHATKMTDESNNDNNNDSSSSNNSVNNNESLIAEAAKILLKNGLNGTSAAAAALFTAATSYQLPTIPLPAASLETNQATTSTLLSNSVIDCKENQLDPPPAHGASSSSSSSNRVTMSSAVASQRSSGLPPASSQYKPTSKDMCLGATSGVTFLAKSNPTTAADTGVIDYTLNTATNGAQRALSPVSSGVGNNRGGGGRLQFFKDGKFILELARSKDGERGGWVSVPRKNFRQPSATTSTVTPASTASACVYPKMETSTSLSFSDDNSSIQSSPWQRDHCWKQTTPKRGISKEMMVYYRHPKDVAITKAGLRIAKLKRRRPYDDSTGFVKDLKFFQRRQDNSFCQEKHLKSDENTRKINNHHLQNGTTKSNSSAKYEDEDQCSTSSAATLVEEIENNNADKITEELKVSTPMLVSRKKQESLSEIVDKTSESEAGVFTSKTTKNDNHDKNDTDTILEVEKMYTSEDERDEKTSMTPNKPESSVETLTPDEIKMSPNTFDVGDETPAAQNQSKTGVEEKRLNKRKLERAKLTFIVQKLIDRMPARVSNLAKIPLSNSSNTQQNNSFSSNKVSPTSSSSSTSPLISTTSSSATASRLVESHHQQHVSPRKRILREFEKVSLEDTTTSCGAGGKRSRAKSTAKPAINSHYQNSRSPNNRVHSNVCSVPASAIAPSSSTMTSSSNGDILQNSSLTSISLKNSKTSASTNVPTTRLYSSYSIHSLLGDQGSSSSGSSCSTSATVNKTSEQPSPLLSNIGYNQHIHQQQKTEHSFHLSKSVSPKSPEAGGGKSPSSNAASKKRSPPYASPMHDSQSRSPSVSNSVDYSPRATPPEFKHRYDRSTGLAEPQQTLLHQQHHRHLQQSGFYSPYMMSPKYDPGTATGTTSPPSTSRSPRHSTAALTSPTTSTTLTSVHPKNIPNSYNNHLSLPPLQHELSPSRSLADYPRDSTPRTVPKKTASIRRQFASPTANIGTHSTTSCSSPSERGIDENILDAKTTNSATTYSQLQQRSSPSGALPSPLHAYYMYPPTGPLQFGGNAVGGGNIGASGTSPISHAAPSSYIPSYYQSYLSALNITKHYYMGTAGIPQSSVSRLSSPFHPMTIPYNGVSAAAVAAAAAAAATAAFSGQQHMGHHPMLPPPSAASAAALYGVGGGFGFGLNAVPTSSSSTSTVHQTNKSTDSSLTIMNADITRETTMSTDLTQSAQFSSNKEELSSDVPLNLSKH